MKLCMLLYLERGKEEVSFGICFQFFGELVWHCELWI